MRAWKSAEPWPSLLPCAIQALFTLCPSYLYSFISRLTEWQNCWDWKCPLEIIWSNFPVQAGSLGEVYTGMHPGVFWISPERETPWPSWAAFEPLFLPISSAQKTPNKPTRKTSDLCRSFSTHRFSLTNSHGREMLKSGICIQGQRALEIKTTASNPPWRFPFCQSCIL